MREALGEHAEEYGPVLEPGTRVAGFLIEAPLAPGGVGTVYRARREGRLYALKLLSLTPRNDREMDALRRLHHPNVVGFQGWGLWPDAEPRFHVLALEYVDGRPLDVWAEEENPSALGLVHQVLLPFTLTLAEVHASGVVHRDVKESNILVRAADGQPVLVDFGAAFHEGAHRLTPRLPPGTPEYRSPELLRFAREWTGEPFAIHPREDLWALGVTFYWLLTRTLPFGDRQGALTQAILHQTPPAPHELNSRVPPALGDVCMRLLKKNAEERYPDARALAQALSDVWSRADRSWNEPLFASTPRPAPAPPVQDQGPLGAWVRVLGLGLLLSLGTPRPEWSDALPPRQAASRQELAPGHTTGEVVGGTGPRTSTPPVPVASATPRKDTEMMTSSKVRSVARAALLTGATCLGSSCASAPAAAPTPGREGPPPAACPEGSTASNERLDIGPGMGHPIYFSGHHSSFLTPVPVKEGRIELQVIGDWRQIPDRSYLTGELFFGKDRVYGRITQLRISGQPPMPVCMIIYGGTQVSDLGLPMEAGSTPPRRAIVLNTPWASVVRSFD